ncbi:hypothetical protein BVG16_04765 [Paenibacillus selenitireducens]|uniref:CPBP family intramembrane metalloprotease domain-containing protein n=1 Tax=Paenibacillus selenitireducens TaxID=1324314 RepID=A0A1T2XK16_9BACL|nr:CPBP family intramembrane glutamic endopeptidase [Paenibacillus selenitireducens]OPA80066.1 hypothetical protein BVG16_04765 [Paenibacillus selenitireducens]
MNHLGNRLQLIVNRKALLITGLIGFLIFVLLQVVPAFSPQALDFQQHAAISKDEAVQKAIDFTEQKWSFAKVDPAHSNVSYATDSELYGYLVANKLLEKYHDTFKKKYPYEYYRVELPDVDKTMMSYYVYLDMQTGKVISWSGYFPLAVPMQTTTDEKIEKAKVFAAEQGYDKNMLTFKGSREDRKLSDRVEILLEDTTRQVGDSRLNLTIGFTGDTVSSFTPSFSVPESHLQYVNQQKKNANWMTGLGFYLLTLVLSILAIVYSALKRRYTSFKRGIFLAMLYTGLNLFSYFNMMPALKAMTGDAPFNHSLFIATTILQCIITVIMGIGTYFSFVGGDGLWRERGLNPWPRFREPGYGDYIFRSMGVGYITAFILLGLQVVIYITLSLTIGTWSTTDATQSTYNMVYPLLFPLMAWVAGIGEEATYRLFGIIMLKKIVRNTFLACLIPTLIWAFGHTLYPIYPTYSRPIELIFLGLGFSFIFLRYGFITAVFAHVIFDSIGMGMSLVFMQNGPTYTLIGLGYMILPAIVAWVIRFFYRFRYPHDGKPEQQKEQQKEEPYITTPPEALV